MKYQVAIIGGGPAGYTAAERAGKAGLSVVLFEKNSVGGVCLNEGCIPTKTLLYASKLYDNCVHARKYNVSAGEVSFDLPKMIARKSKVVRKLVLGVKAKLTGANVTLVNGEAFIVDAHTVRCAGEIYECENLILCTGSQTVIPPIPGIEKVGYWTHRDALDNKEIPRSLAIIGGGVIGMEFASFFSDLGVKVTVIEMMDEILNGIDREIASILRADYAKRGVDFKLGAKVVRLEQNETGMQVYYQTGAEETCFEAEKLLLSVGRRPVTQGFGLENLSLAYTERKCIKVNVQLQTSVPGVYACGDLNGVSLLAHTAVKEAEIAVDTILGKSVGMSYRAIPGVVYTHPEVASVGKTEEMLQKQGITYRAVKFPMTYSGRFVAENEGVNGMMKVLVDEHNKVLGVHLLGNPASELIVLGGIMVEDELDLEAFRRYVFPHPTVGELFRDL